MKMLFKAPQWRVFNCDQRFRVLVAGRRFGKTQLGLVEAVRGAWGPGRLAWYVAPTYRWAKRVAWNRLKQMTKPYWAARPNETDLRIDLITGGTIALRGADNYDSLRGDGLDLVVLDEFATMAPKAWTEVLRPALSDRLGRALFIGTPKGRNHFYELYESATSQAHWAAFQFTTEQGGYVSAEELENAAHELDERTYDQEFRARFTNQGRGVAYYAFDRRRHVRPVAYNPTHPLFWALDFNTSPLCSVIGQMINDRVYILEELILPDSNTPAACEEFVIRTRKWTNALGILEPLPDMNEAQAELLQQLQQHHLGTLNLYIYGDATGTQRKTSATRTDWQIVRDFFGRHSDRYRASLRISKSNPLVKDRVNCVNAVLRNYAGQHRLMIDPGCKHLIKDLEQVCWKADPYGNPTADLDKSDPMRTHVSDALGYMIAQEFPMRLQAGERSGPLLV